MSRSYRQPVVVSTPQIDKDIAHRQVRRAVRAELTKLDPDPIIIEADTREMEKEEWGTKIDFIYIDPDSEWQTKNQKKFSRK